MAGAMLFIRGRKWQSGHGRTGLEIGVRGDTNAGTAVSIWQTGAAGRRIYYTS